MHTVPAQVSGEAGNLPAGIVNQQLLVHYICHCDTSSLCKYVCVRARIVCMHKYKCNCAFAALIIKPLRPQCISARSNWLNVRTSTRKASLYSFAWASSAWLCYTQFPIGSHFLYDSLTPLLVYLLCRCVCVCMFVLVCTSVKLVTFWHTMYTCVFVGGRVIVSVPNLSISTVIRRND